MAETTYTNIGAKYYLEYTQLVIIDTYKYISLPKDSAFAINPNFYARVYDISGSSFLVHAADVTFSGYDMSTTGFQDVTVSYTCPNNQVLTATITLHVYGTSSWRTLWSGTESILLHMRDTTTYEFVINNVNTGSYRQVKALPITTDEPIVRKYIGYDSQRKLRLTYQLNRKKDNAAFTIGGNSRPVDLSTYTYTFDYNLSNQVGASANYNTVTSGLTFMLLNEDQNTRYQALFVRLADNITSGVDSIIVLNNVWSDGNLHVGSIFEFTLTKLEVQE